MKVFVLLGLLSGFSVCAEAVTQVIPSTEAVEESQYDLNYPQGVELKELLKAYSVWAKKNLLLPKDFSGKAEILCTKKVSLSEAYQIILSALAKDNFTTLETGSVLKVIKLTEAKLAPVSIIKEGQEFPLLDKVATKVLMLKHVGPSQIREYLGKVMDTAGLTTYEQSNLLIVTDTLFQLRKIEKLVELLDAPSSRGELMVLEPRWTPAKVLLGQVQSLLEADPHWGSSIKSGKAKLLVDEPTERIFVYGPKHLTNTVKELALKLDNEPEETPEVSSGVRVLPLNYSEAPKLASFLASIRTKPSAPMSRDDDPNFKILADEGTNSLIVNGTHKSFAEVNRLVRKLDEKKTLVFLEVEILDLQVDNGFQFGTSQLMGANGKSFKMITGWESANVGGVSSASILSQQDKSLSVPNQALAPFAQDLTIGVLTGQPLSIAGMGVFSPGALLKLIKTDAYTKVLSSPYILTLHNQEATVSVGERFYFKSDKFDPQAKIYKEELTNIDAEISLGVKPSVTGSGYIKLAVNLDASLILELTEDGMPVLGKRKLKQEILLKSGQTGFVGGLKNHQQTQSGKKIPFLGEIPILGILFNNYRKTYMSSNLLVLMTPYAIYGSDDFKAIYKKHIKEQDELMVSKGLKFSE